EIHRSRIRGHTDISQIAGAISRRDIHAPAKRNSEVSKVAAHAPLLGKTSRSAPCRIGVLISERDMPVNEITDRLHPSPAGRGAAKKLPCLIHHQVGLAIPAGKQEHQCVMRQVGYGMLLSRKVDAIRLATVSDDG